MPERWHLMHIFHGLGTRVNMPKHLNRAIIVPLVKLLFLKFFFFHSLLFYQNVFITVTSCLLPVCSATELRIFFHVPVFRPAPERSSYELRLSCE